MVHASLEENTSTPQIADGEQKHNAKFLEQSANLILLNPMVITCATYFNIQ